MEAAERLSLVGRRRSFLEELAEGPMAKRDLTGAVDRSRSTVDRGLAELETAGFVRRDADGRYGLTRVGRLTLETYREALATADAIEAAGSLLDHLPAEIEVPPALFRSAEVRIAEGPHPLDDPEPLVQWIEDASFIQLFGRADHAPAVIPLLYRRTVVEEAAEVQAVVNPQMRSRLREEYAAILEEAETSPRAEIRHAPSLPFGLWLISGPAGEAVFVAIHDANLRLRGHVFCTDAAAVEWSRQVFEERWRTADPFA